MGRIKQLIKYNIVTVIIVSFIWLFAVEGFPNAFVHLFMSPTDEVLKIAPRIIRLYGLSFLFLPFNIYMTYYFQAVLRPKTSLTVSIMRGIVVSGALILILPIIAGVDSIWFAMPITEFVTAIYAGYCLMKQIK